MSRLIATHSGTFHCDEALAIAMLRKVPDYADATLLRSRDEAELARADVVVDVGGVYDASRHRYDHHQKGFTETFGHGFVTKLSSGQVFHHHVLFAHCLRHSWACLQAFR